MTEPGHRKWPAPENACTWGNTLSASGNPMISFTKVQRGSPRLQKASRDL